MTIYTAHYEGRTADAFLQQLVEQGIGMLVDVREAPISRKPGFSKSALACALRRNDIEYRHMRMLGCPKPVRDAYREDGDWPRYTRFYLRHLSRQQQAVEELAALFDEVTTALLCYEADFNRCHRTYVARAVAALNGSAVCHITTAGLVRETATGLSASVGRSR